MTIITNSREGMNATRRISITYRSIDDLKPNPTNPRRHTKKADPADRQKH
jgi:hypothetical protein